MAAAEVTVVGPVFAMSMDLLGVFTQVSPGIIIPTRRGMKRAAVAGTGNEDGWRGAWPMCGRARAGWMRYPTAEYGAIPFFSARAAVSRSHSYISSCVQM